MRFAALLLALAGAAWCAPSPVPLTSMAAEEALKARVRHRLESGDLAGALKDLDVLVEQGSHRPDMRLRRGRVLDELGRLEEAARDFAAVNTERHEDPEAWRRLAVVEAVRGRWDAAAQALARMRPEFVDLTFHPDASLLRAVIPLRAGKRAESAAFARETLKRDWPAWPKPLVQWMAGELPEAELWRAASTADRQTEVRAVLGLAGGAKPSPGQRAHLEWIAKNGPCRLAIGRIALAELARLGGAAPQPEARPFPGSPGAEAHVAERAYRRGDAAAAQALCERLLKTAEAASPPDPLHVSRWRANLAAAHAYQGRTQTAQLVLEKGIPLVRAPLPGRVTEVVPLWEPPGRMTVLAGREHELPERYEALALGLAERASRAASTALHAGDLTAAEAFYRFAIGAIADDPAPREPAAPLERVLILERWGRRAEARAEWSFAADVAARTVASASHPYERALVAGLRLHRGEPAAARRAVIDRALAHLKATPRAGDELADELGLDLFEVALQTKDASLAAGLKALPVRDEARGLSEGDVAWLEGRLEEAERAYAKEREGTRWMRDRADPTVGLASARRGEVLLLLSRPAAAVRALWHAHRLQALELGRAHATTLRTQQRLLAALGAAGDAPRRERVEADLASAQAQREGRDARRGWPAPIGDALCGHYQMLADAALAAGDHEEALSALALARRVVESAPRAPGACADGTSRRFGLVRHAQRRWPEAASELAAVSPGDEGSLLALGTIGLEHYSSSERARRALRELIGLIEKRDGRDAAALIAPLHTLAKLESNARGRDALAAFDRCLALLNAHRAGVELRAPVLVDLVEHASSEPPKVELAKLVDEVEALRAPHELLVRAHLGLVRVIGRGRERAAGAPGHLDRAFALLAEMPEAPARLVLSATFQTMLVEGQTAHAPVEAVKRALALLARVAPDEVVPLVLELASEGTLRPRARDQELATVEAFEAGVRALLPDEPLALEAAAKALARARAR